MVGSIVERFEVKVITVMKETEFVAHYPVANIHGKLIFSHTAELDLASRWRHSKAINNE